MSGHATSRPKRGPGHPITQAKPWSEIRDGAEVVHIPLSGKHGIGRAAIIDECDWRWISRIFGTKWNLGVTPKDPAGRVMCATAQATKAAGLIGFQMSANGHPLVLLARLVAAAERGDRVFVKNGNTLDLRRDNLEALSNDTIAAFMADIHNPINNQRVEVG